MLGRTSGRGRSGHDIEEASNGSEGDDGFLEVQIGCYMVMHFFH